MTGHDECGGSKAPMTQTRAAELLGVTREHLNRVLNGRRQSRSLRARWESLKTQHTKVMSEEANRFSGEPAPGNARGVTDSVTVTSAGTSRAIDPAAANFCTEWVAGVCAKIGLTAVVIGAPYSPELWANSGFEARLDEELRAAHLGHYDSAKFGNPIAFFFYLSSERLTEGLQLIKDRLSAIGLLSQVKIGYSDSDAKRWRVFYPEEKASQ